MLEGELLAVERDSVFVLTQGGDVRSEQLDRVERALLAFYAPGTGPLAIWSILGAVSTISNGAFLLFTFPAWVIGGSLAARGQSRAPLYRIDDRDDWSLARLYARFPARLPPDLPRRLPPKSGG
jgi:hypothetical protein